MKIWLLFLTLACLTACQKDRDEPVNAVLAGEWRYVGTFSHLADYRCFVCPGFDYNTAPTLNINALGGLSGKSVINQYSGSYQAADKDTIRAEFLRGTFSVKRLSQTKIAGTPAQMQIENEYFDKLQKTTNYYIGRTEPQYLNLSLNQAKNHLYLYFVRKK